MECRIGPKGGLPMTRILDAMERVFALRQNGVCKTLNCDESAQYVVHWPGHDIRLCPQCALRAVRIAESMSFPVSFDEIQQPEEKETTT